MSYKEKERELSVAMSKIEALSRQLDELRKGNISNSYNIKGYKNSIELDKLRQELLVSGGISFAAFTLTDVLLLCFEV